MYEIYDEIFKYSDLLNPISLQNINSAGKLANLGKEKSLVDLGSGKGGPSLFIASTFGVTVDGFDLSRINVEYANERAKLLNLSSRVKYFCQDLKGFIPRRNYDIVASLGIEMEIYGGRECAFNIFRSILKDGGVLLYAEPVWKVRPVSPEILKALCSREDSFLTIAETQNLIRKTRFQELSHFISSKDDWEVYVRSPILRLREMIAEKSVLGMGNLAKMLEGFEMESEAAGTYWDMVLWVAKPS